MSETSRGPLYFIHISDTHFGPSKEFLFRSENPYRCAERFASIVRTLPVRPDFIIHTGDVCSFPDSKGYKIAESIFAGLKIPIYYATGNHDLSRDINFYLTMGEKEDLFEEKDILAYRFTRKGYEFLTIDARAPDDMDPHGLLSEAMIHKLQSLLVPEGPPLVVFGHFPALPLNAPWMDRNMLITNGTALHKLLVGAGKRLKGYLYGHVHQSMQNIVDGVIYQSVPSLCSSFGGWPIDEEISFDPEYPPGFNFVTLLGDRMIVRQHIFSRH